MIDFDDKEIKRFSKDLQTFKKSAFPYATRNTLNTLAFEGQKIARNEVQSKMILRNKFTIASIQYEKTNSLNIDNQESRFGSIATYMETQEIGGSKHKKGKIGIGIATGYSANQEGARPRTKLPTRTNRMKNIVLQNRIQNAKTLKQKNLITIRQSAKEGIKFIFLDLGKTKGIFKIVGGKKNPRIKMVHSLSKTSVIIKKNEWLQPSRDKVIEKAGDIFKSSLLFQLKRHKIFKQ